MDRNRLDEVKQTDLTESRVNEEFVDWLKNKGPTYLLGGLVVLLVVLFVMRLRERQHQGQVQAWNEFQSSALPSALEDLASEYEGIDAISNLARLQAADAYLTSVQANFPLEADPTTEPDLVITADERQSHLENADRLYAEVVESDDGSREMTLVVVNALNGRAAVAEARGNLGEARELYEQAAARAEAYFPDLASMSRRRAETASNMESIGGFPSESEVDALTTDEPEATPVSLDPAFRPTLLTPLNDES